MRILIYTDIHWAKYSSILRRDTDKYTQRLDNIIESLNWAEALATEKGCDRVVCLGDFFDKPTLDAIEITALSEIKWNELPHTFLVGNHEISQFDDTVSTAHIFNMANFEIIDKPTSRTYENTPVLYLPYITEGNRKFVNDYCNEFNLDSKPIIFSHNDIMGIKYGAVVSTQGFDITDIVDNSLLFINGHIHNGDWVVRNKVLNLGNLTGQNFSEDGFKYEHNIAILDTNTLNIELIRNPLAINFYKLDFTIKNDIDYINRTSERLKRAVVSVTCNREHYTFMRALFDPSYQHTLETKCANVLAGKVNVNIENQTTQDIDNKITELRQVNYLDKFEEYVIKELGNTDIINELLKEVCG